eukprot:CAMPEP_0182444798 /NCGR_PEP_ID=MMETSP1172-20130603/3134_1 /TAXON_ID=708627 /ORGANISM="Timspurckia oligopyrenoides, Strain CCMP3278" /LENGTH=186 /DNA_ID=CAMNT_0024640437 /DNA_START=117 /DNA_END=677 /DNA_ORIENTATION=+
MEVIGTFGIEMMMRARLVSEWEIVDSKLNSEVLVQRPDVHLGKIGEQILHSCSVGTPVSGMSKVSNESSCGKRSRCEEDVETINEDSEVKRTKGEHECVQCGKAFTRRSGLVQHVLAIHEKKRPFECKNCDRSFAQKTGLQEHQKVVHDKIRSHLCGVCDQAFGKSSDVKRHVEKVHRPHLMHTIE